MKKITEETQLPCKVFFAPNGKYYTAYKFSKNGLNLLLKDSTVSRWEPYFLCEEVENEDIDKEA